MSEEKQPLTLPRVKKTITYKIKEIKRGQVFISRKDGAIWFFKEYNPDTYNVRISSKSGKIDKWIKATSLRVGYKKGK
ncbi:hypothetical protein LCGC14_1500560 [marine sediment metagenome]|uniref:Uncharacterized protein n=1 Tax=marine sediment metagenome TaxID=412755 RepID=A0A0F9J466_9ZZZZ